MDNSREVLQYLHNHSISSRIVHAAQKNGIPTWNDSADCSVYTYSKSPI